MVKAAVEAINEAMSDHTAVNHVDMTEALEDLKVFDVCASWYEQGDNGVEENYKTSHAGLTIDEAPALYEECRGYPFRRIKFAGNVIAEGF